MPRASLRGSLRFRPLFFVPCPFVHPFDFRLKKVQVFPQSALFSCMYAKKAVSLQQNLKIDYHYA